MRALPLIGLCLTALAAAGGCETSAKTLPCNSSVAEYCGLYGNCVLTWDEAQSDTVFCSALMPSRADCGRYHGVTLQSLDTAVTYYYDVSSGELVAIIGSSPPIPMSVCAAGPAGGFTLPTCTGPLSEPLPQCVDGGADSATD